jgi:hypothetical protein
VGSEYVITGRRQVVQESKLEICVHLMDLTSDDKHNMQLDPNYIPSPAVNDRLSSGFHIPITTNIAYETGFMTSLTPYLIATLAGSIRFSKMEDSSLF